jgi:Arm DNA-binding domain
MKNHQKLTLLFWHRKSKADAKGNAPIICRISIEGEESEELAIGRKVHLKNWDVENKKAKGGILEKATNLKISEVIVDLNQKFTISQAEYEHITPLMLKNVYRDLPAMLGKGLPKPKVQIMPTLLQVSDLHVSNFSKMV